MPFLKALNNLIFMRISMDILEKIIQKRREDLNVLGAGFGFDIPKERRREITPFLKEKGVILEIKRKSPTKGNIAPNLNAFETAQIYAENNARAISVLTERHFFGGSLIDLMDTARAVDTLNLKQKPAILRKDFLLTEKEIEVSYLFGADAILLIARILEKEELLKLIQKAQHFNLSVLLEIREEDDLNKLQFLLENNHFKNIVVGVNARDLKTFQMDLLYPLKIKSQIHQDFSQLPIVFESGILSESAAALPALLGFHGILLGEAAAQNPQNARIFTKTFETTPKSKVGDFYQHFIKRNSAPLIKICGLTNIEDTQNILNYNPDFLGFVLAKKSKRIITKSFLKECAEKLDFKNTKRIGVIADENEIPLAVECVKENLIDAIQFHNISIPLLNNADFYHIPRFPVAIMKNENDLNKIQDFFKKGFPRVLIDSGEGSGKAIHQNLILSAKKIMPLFLAGGMNNENIGFILKEYAPDLIDLASGLEQSPGIKDFFKIKQFFQLLNKK